MFKSKLHQLKRSLVGKQLQQQETILVNQGRLLAQMALARASDDIRDFEFKVFSQFGEDGIIQHLISRIPGICPFFVEFGVETFEESNCRFLMLKDRWSGAVLDGSARNISAIRSAPWYWRSQLVARDAFVDRDNIVKHLRELGVPAECGIVSIDLDGVDYFVFEALEPFRPAIFICEYNALFGNEAAVSVPYDPAFVRERAHFSGSYFGASLRAFAQLADRRGYALVGVTTESVNAFFVRRDLLWHPAAERAVEDVWLPLGHRQARDQHGRLTFAKMEQELSAIADLPLVDVTTGSALKVGDLPPIAGR